MKVQSPREKLPQRTPSQRTTAAKVQSSVRDAALIQAVWAYPRHLEKSFSPKAGGGRGAAVNDAVAYIRGLAELNGRNADWAAEAVRTAVSLPASEALKLHVNGALDDAAKRLPPVI
jgi:membrane-bound ClpP family serine protease